MEYKYECIASNYTYDPPFLYTKLIFVYNHGLFFAEFWKYYDYEEKEADPYRVFTFPQLLRKENLMYLFEEMSDVDPWFEKGMLNPTGYTFESFAEKIKKSALWFHRRIKSIGS